MEFNDNLLEKIKVLNNLSKKIKEDKKSLLNNTYYSFEDIMENSDEAINLIDEIINAEPDADLRELYYQYSDYLEQEEYILCKEKLEEIKNYQKIN